MNESILDKIIDIIRTSNKSIHEIARESGVSKSAIAQWLNGESAPTVLNAEAVLHTIGHTLILKNMGELNINGD